MILPSFTTNSIPGMNDVLPKPFTKEGLLSMLEKHLGHLKKHPQPSLDMNPAQASAPVKRSHKSDDSPATSPATVSNWNSPGNIGVSPASAQVEDPYLHPTHNGTAPGHAPYAMPPQTGMPPPPVQAPMYGGVSLSPGGLGPRPSVQHRRGISEISGGPPDMVDAKRQQLYAGGVGPNAHMQHLTATPSLPHIMHQQPGHGMPRSR
jgi:osomolarity two-component system response regulator SKN7